MWALIQTASADHRLMVRRSLHPGEKGQPGLAYFWCYAPSGAALAELAAVAGARWAVEDCFAEAKNETGLDQYQVRKYRAWYRHITLAMLAHAFLAVTAHASLAAGSGEPGKKVTLSLWTTIHPAQDIRTARIHN